jgi:DNA repair exonuclease SbcCD nuclease subunit
MLLFHCADLHIGSGDIAEGVNCLHRMVDEVIGSKADALLIAGDLFDRVVTRPAVEAAVHAFMRLKRANIPVYCVDGNHDECVKAGHDYLGLLHSRSLVHLLYPVRDAAGEPRIAAYDGEAGCVAYAGGVRILGFGFLGDTTKQRLLSLSRELEPYDGFTIALLHTGVYDGEVPVGGIVSGDLRVFNGLVDYFALGHRHAREEHGNAYNPGALCCVRMNAPNEEHGYYRICAEGGAFSVQFVPVG